jgi:hypothetical protein
LVRGVGEKYASNNNAVSDNVDKSGEEGGGKNIQPELVKSSDTSMLGNTEQKTLAREEEMNLEIMRKVHSIEDGNIIHGISLLVSLDNALDKDRQIIEALNMISLSVKRKVVSVVVSDPDKQAATASPRLAQKNN